LLDAVRSKGRVVDFALPGSEELRYLEFMEAWANVGGEHMEHMLLREDARRIEVVEEFLHGTQLRLGIIDRLGVRGSEMHVKSFMIRHARLLGVAPEDVAVLHAMLGVN